MRVFYIFFHAFVVVMSMSPRLTTNARELFVPSGTSSLLSFASNDNNRYPHDVTGSFKGRWYSSPKSRPAPELKSFSNDDASPQGERGGGGGTLHVQLRQENDNWVEGNLRVETERHVRGSSYGREMHVNFAGVYVRPTGTILGHGKSLNFDVAMEGDNSSVYRSHAFREALRTAASDTLSLLHPAGIQNKVDEVFDETSAQKRELDDKRISIFEALHRQQRLNSLFSTSRKKTAYPHPCVFALKLFIEPGRYEGMTKRNESNSEIMSIQTQVWEEIPDAQFDASITGTLVSENCGLDMIVNATTFKMQKYYRKAIRYGYVAIAIVPLQLFALAKQVEYTGNSQTSLSKLSILSIGFQATIDAYFCLAHLVFGLVVEAIFPSFACIAFLEFILFSVFEMRLLLHAWKMRNAANNVSTWNDLRRELSVLYGKFYAGFFGGGFVLFALRQFPLLCTLLLSSYWIPQIGWNMYNNSRKPLLPSYILTISATRLFLPLYFFGCPANFARNEQNLLLCSAVVLYFLAQVIILLSQHYAHPRIFTFGLTKFLPEVFDYHKVKDATGDCSICLNDLKGALPTIQMQAPCSHVFHAQCLQRWMDVKLECPTCRLKLPPL